MNPIATHAESVLHASPHPALRLTELLQLIATQVGYSVTVQRLRTALEGHPDRFRIVEAWQMPWRVREVRHPPERDEPGGRRRRGPDSEPDAWVLAVSTPDRPPDAPGPVLRLRESVRWLALGIDGRSRIEASRWYAIAMAERATRAAVARRIYTGRRAA